MAAEFTTVLRKGAEKAAGFSARLMRDLDSGLFSMPKGLDVIYRSVCRGVCATHGSAHTSWPLAC